MVRWGKLFYHNDLLVCDDFWTEGGKGGLKVNSGGIKGRRPRDFFTKTPHLMEWSKILQSNGDSKRDHEKNCYIVFCSQLTISGFNDLSEKLMAPFFRSLFNSRIHFTISSTFLPGIIFFQLLNINIINIMNYPLQYSTFWTISRGTIDHWLWIKGPGIDLYIERINFTCGELWESSLWLTKIPPGRTISPLCLGLPCDGLWKPLNRILKLSTQGTQSQNWRVKLIKIYLTATAKVWSLKNWNWKENCQLFVVQPHTHRQWSHGTRGWDQSLTEDTEGSSAASKLQCVTNRFYDSCHCFLINLFSFKYSSTSYCTSSFLSTSR